MNTIFYFSVREPLEKVEIDPQQTQFEDIYDPSFLLSLFSNILSKGFFLFFFYSYFVFFNFFFFMNKIKDLKWIWLNSLKQMPLDF